MSKRDKKTKASPQDASALAKAAAKAASNGAPLGHKALSALAKLKAELDAKEQKLREEREAKAKREAEFRAKIGLHPEKRAAHRSSEAASAPHRGPMDSKTSKPGARKTDSIEVWRPDLDQELFAAAMAGVEPLATRDRPGRAAGAHEARRPSKLAEKARRASAEGDVGLTVRWREDGTCEASRAGAAFALEALDRLASVQDTVDLHGLDVTEARARVLEFVRSRRARGLRVVEVVHGTGKHAPDGHCVLRDAAAAALSEVPASREVEAFKSREGSGPHGSASILVALRAR